MKSLLFMLVMTFDPGDEKPQVEGSDPAKRLI